MELKNRAIIVTKIEERTYEFLCDHTSPLGEIHDVLCFMKKYVIERITQAEEQEEKPTEQLKSLS